MRINPYPELIRTPYPEPYPENFRSLIRMPYPRFRRLIQALSGRLVWISLSRVSGPGHGPGHGMAPISSQNLIRPYPPGIVVARGLIRPYPFFFLAVFLRYKTVGFSDHFLGMSIGKAQNHQNTIFGHFYFCGL